MDSVNLCTQNVGTTTHLLTAAVISMHLNRSCLLSEKGKVLDSANQLLCVCVDLNSKSLLKIL